MHAINRLKVLAATTAFLACITVGLQAESPAGAVAPNNSTTVYLVRQGDCLSKIAQNYGTTVTELVRLNKLPNQNILSIGQSIRIQKSGKAPVGAVQKESENSGYLNIFVEKESEEPDYPKINKLNKKLNDDIQNAQYRQALETTEQILANVTRFKEKLTEVVEVLP